MVVITKGHGDDGKRLVVPSAAYDNFYKGAGWRKVDDNSVVPMKKTKRNVDTAPVSDVNDVDDADEWDGYEDDQEEYTKPLSEMNREELEKYAEKLGVDLTGLSTAKQYREAIKAVV